MNGILGGVFLDLEFIEQQCLLYVMHIVCGGKKWVISPHWPAAVEQAHAGFNQLQYVLYSKFNLLFDFDKIHEEQ